MEPPSSETCPSRYEATKGLISVYLQRIGKGALDRKAFVDQLLG
jgi:hypothetical protein